MSFIDLVYVAAALAPAATRRPKSPIVSRERSSLILLNSPRKTDSAPLTEPDLMALNSDEMFSAARPKLLTSVGTRLIIALTAARTADSASSNAFENMPGSLESFSSVRLRSAPSIDPKSRCMVSTKLLTTELTSEMASPARPAVCSHSEPIHCDTVAVVSPIVTVSSRNR